MGKHMKTPLSMDRDLRGLNHLKGPEQSKSRSKAHKELPCRRAGLFAVKDIDASECRSLLGLASSYTRHIPKKEC